MRFFNVFCAVVALVTFSVPAQAGKRAIKDNGVAVADVDIPDGWVSSEVESGLMVRSPDSEAFVWIETAFKGDEKALYDARARVMMDKGVVFGGKPTQVDNTYGRLVVRITEYPNTTFKGGRTLVRSAWVNPGLPNRRLVLVTFWSSYKGGMYDEDVFGMTIGLTFNGR